VQNTLDDLLSYFRFLRYQPYCHPKQFKELIKDKVAANQDNGFKVRRLLALWGGACCPGAPADALGLNFWRQRRQAAACEGGATRAAPGAAAAACSQAAVGPAADGPVAYHRKAGPPA
jgi:hypothetical protein